jgi:iron complex transport system ATP-binding protein
MNLEPIEQPAPLQAKNVRVRRGARTIVQEVNLSFKSGEITAIIGANGAGKTTLIRAFAGLAPLELNDGEMLLDGKPMTGFSKAGIARRLAFLPAHSSVPFPLTIAELINQAEPKPEARAAAIRAMELESLEFVPMTKLSTGEARRAWIAMTLARETRILLLDEPLSGLDPRYQMRLLETLQARAAHGSSIVFIAHDLPYASRVDRVIALNGAKVVADGTPLEVLQPQLLRELYGVEVWIGSEPQTGAVFPLPIKAV